MKRNQSVEERRLKGRAYGLGRARNKELLGYSKLAGEVATYFTQRRKQKGRRVWGDRMFGRKSIK